MERTQGSSRQIVTRIEMKHKQFCRHCKKPLALGSVVAIIPLIQACGQNGIQTLSATARDYSYSPGSWTVQAGQRVSLRMVNESNNEHEWVLLKQNEQVTLPFDADDETRIDFESEVEPGNAKVSLFTAPVKAGRYRIVCGIPGHLEQGMEGTLVVQ